MSCKTAVIGGVFALTACTSVAHPPPVARRPEPTASSCSERPSSIPVAHGGGPLSLDAAVSRLVDAKCAQTERCAITDTIDTHESHEQCIAKLDSRLSDEARLSCASGVDPKALARCVDDLSSSTCATSNGDGLPRACRFYALCFEP